MVDHCLQSKMFDVLLQNDQLQYNMRAGEVFPGFEEAPITFPPTYKFDKNAETYDTSDKRRIPSYTDRILIHSANDAEIQQTAYGSLHHIQISDHRPVFAIFKLGD